MLYWTYILTFLSLFLGANNLHDFHLSKTDIHYKTDQQSLQITVHTFIDDTEAAMREIENLPYKFFENSEHAATDSIFSMYLTENIIITINGEQQECYYLGKEQSEDIQAVYAYLEIENVSAFDEIEIQNSLLMELFDDQRNVINFKIDNKSKAFHMLNKGDDKKLIKL